MPEADPGPLARLIPTAQGDARLITWPAEEPRLQLLLQHGANGKVDARDLTALVAALPSRGVTTHLLQQPFAVAGKRIAPRPAALDESLAEVVAALDPPASELPLVLGGRSSGARCSTRCAGPLGAVAALALAFPLHPPGRPDKSRVEELLGVTVPTLVLQGTRDTFGGPEEFPDHPVLPDHVTLVPVPGADHGFRAGRGRTQAEVLDQVVAATASYLDRL